MTGLSERASLFLATVGMAPVAAMLNDFLADPKALLDLWRGRK